MTEFTAVGVSMGADPRIELQRSGPIVLRNSKLLCLLTRLGGVVGGLLAVVMGVLCVAVLVDSLSPVSGSGLLNAVWCAFAALSFGVLCIRLWKLGRDMVNFQVVLDQSGVHFSLGSKQEPVEKFLAWDQIATIKRRRAGNAQQYFVGGKDGSALMFSSYTFFRPKKVAKLIAQWSGVAIEKM